MIYLRYRAEDAIFYGIRTPDGIRRLAGDIFSGDPGAFSPAGPLDAPEQVRLLAPCVPSKVVAVGRNYMDHIREGGGDSFSADPTLFIKPSTSVIGPDDPIVKPDFVGRLDYEGELAAVIGKTAKNVCAADASAYILGYTCLNDVTARDIQESDGQWTRGKGMDTFCPVGPWITDEIDPNSAGIETKLNGKVVQSSNTSYQHWKIAALIECITAAMTLLPGDIITTGTPSGIGPMFSGDVVEVTVAGIGTLRNTIA